MKTYHGFRDRNQTAHVYVRSGRARRPLRMRLDLDNHSPTGLEWGYPGSGPAQLALALLADALHDSHRALRLHQPFKWKVVALLPTDEPWTMTDDEVRAHADALDAEMMAHG